MKKIKYVIPLIILMISLIITIVYAVVVENAINENHQVSLVSDVYSISANNTNNLNYVSKDVNDNNVTITKGSSSTGTIAFDYTVIAIPNGGTLKEGIIVKERVQKNLTNDNTDTFTIVSTDSVYGKTCDLVVIPYQSYNIFISSFEDLKMLNNEFRHQVINNDSEITQTITNTGENSYEFLENIYSSDVYKDIYLLNDITITNNFTINIPCSIHLLKNDIVLNNDLTLEHFYKGKYIIDRIDGEIIKNTYEFTIRTPLSVNVQNELDSNNYVVDNTEITYIDALNFASSFFVDEITIVEGETTTNYSVLFKTPILPRIFINDNILLSYYTNYSTTKEVFSITRETNNQMLEVTIEAKDKDGTILGTRVVNVWVVGTLPDSENQTLAKILESVTRKGLNNHTNKVSINLTSTLNSFLNYTNKTISLSGTDYVNNFVLSSDGVELLLDSNILTIQRNTYNGTGYIYINGSNIIYAEIDLLTLDIDSVLEIIENDIGQIFFSTSEVSYPITSEEAYETIYHLDNVEFQLKEVFSNVESDTDSITYDSGNLQIVNVNAVYNLLYTYFLKVVVTEGEETYTISKEIIVPSSSTGSGEQNSIVSNLFTTNFNMMSNFIGTSNNFSSSYAKFYMEIVDGANLNSYINIYNVSDNSLFDGTQEINDKRFYFKTTDTNIPTTDTVVYVNVYVTDREQYLSGNDLKNAYVNLQTFDLSNGIYTAGGDPITQIYNSSRTINITYDAENNVTSINSSDHTVTTSNPTINLTSYSYDIVNNGATLTSSIFYNSLGMSITVFLQEYSFIIPGIYRENVFGTNLYESLMDQYGYFQEILPTDSVEIKDRYLLSSSIERENELFTNSITLGYTSNVCTTVTNVKETNGEYNINLHNYFYYNGLSSVKQNTFYESDGVTVIDEDTYYNVINGLYNSAGDPIETIYKEISSATNLSSIVSLSNLNKTKSFDIKNVDIGFADLKDMLNVENDYLQTLTLQNCNITDSSKLNFSLYSNLETVDLSYNNIVNVPAFGMRVTELYLNNNELNNISDIKDIYSLEILHLENNKIGEFLPLQYLDKLKTISLSNNNPTVSVINIGGTNLNAYGSNGKINIPTLVILRDKGIAITNNYIPSLTDNLLEYEACYDINAIFPLDLYHGSFYLDLSKHLGYTLDFDGDSVEDTAVILAFTIYINGSAITNTSNVFTSGVLANGSYDAVIKMVYTNTDYTTDPDTTTIETIYRLIHFTITN